MELLQAAFLGLVQGLTEFLPVSSSGHLYLLPHMFGWEHAGLTFDVALHLGSLLAVIVYFWKDLWSLFWGFCSGLRHPKHFKEKESSRMSLYILLGIIPAGVVGLLFDDLIEQYARTPAVVVAMLIVVGVLFLFIEHWAKPDKKFGQIRLRDALLIGLFQTLALIPGVSRSGITMLTALLLGLRHEAGAKFSFLLGTPLIAAAGTLKMKDLLETGIPPETMAYFATGMIVAAISGYLCIKFFLQFLRNHSFRIFGWYRILAGLGFGLVLFL